MGLLYDIINKKCDRIPGINYPAYLTKEKRWVIGSYMDMQRLATNWRHTDDVRKKLFELEARTGRRKTDVSPTGTRTIKRYASEIAGTKPEVP